MTGQVTALFARLVLFVRNDGLVRRSKSRCRPSTCGMAPAGVPTTYGTFWRCDPPPPSPRRHDLSRLERKRDPNPSLLALAAHEGPDLIEFQTVVGLGHHERLFQVGNHRRASASEVPLFPQPFGQSIAADLEHAGNTAHGSTFLVGGEHLLLEGLGVAALLGRVDKGSCATTTAETLRGLGRSAMANDAWTVTLRTANLDPE